MVLKSSFFSLLLSFSITGAASATTVIDFTNKTGTESAREFSEGTLTVTFKPSSSSPQAFVASSSQGLCLYAQSQDGTPRCGGSGSVPTPFTYDFIEMTSNRDIFFTGGIVKQITGTANAVNISSSIGGPVLASIPASQTPFSFSPIFVSSSQSVFFSGSGINTSTRLESFSFEEVPGPLPLLGAAAAFGTSRRIRKKLKSLS